MNRFARIELLYGEDALDRLKDATVVVAGMGAVGSFAVEALARSGLGHLRLIDFDEIRESNLNRQLFALDSTVGKMKADTAAARVHDINPECKVEAIRDFIDADTAGRILSEPPDVLIDAIDSLNPKTALLKIAADCGTRTIVSSMGAAQRTDPLAVRVDDISQTFNCPLARLMRKRLRRLGVHQGIRCVYSIEKPVGRRIRVDEAEDDFLQRGRKRETLGSFVCLTGIFGLVAAREAIQSIVGSPAGAALGNPMPTSL